MFIVGLTGGIGSGKTAVSDRFSAKGITIVDADLCSRVVVEPGKPALKTIIEHFGKEIATSEGTLDRAALRQRVFSNPEEKKWLESLLHPLIAEQVWRELEAAKTPYVMLVSPLLVESRQNLICDRVLVVDVPEETQIARTTVRDNNSAEQVGNIIKTQASRTQRLQLATDVIENIHGLDYLDQQVELLHQQFLELARKKADGDTP
jgi:dephospho-CoA kinase